MVWRLGTVCVVASSGTDCACAAGLLAFVGILDRFARRRVSRHSSGTIFGLTVLCADAHVRGVASIYHGDVAMAFVLISLASLLSPRRMFSGKCLTGNAVSTCRQCAATSASLPRF